MSYVLRTLVIPIIFAMSIAMAMPIGTTLTILMGFRPSDILKR